MLACDNNNTEKIFVLCDNSLLTYELLSSPLNTTGGFNLQKKKQIMGLPTNDPFLDLFSLTPGGLQFNLYLLTMHSVYLVQSTGKPQSIYSLQDSSFTCLTGYYHLGNKRSDFKGALLYIGDSFGFLNILEPIKGVIIRRIQLFEPNKINVQGGKGDQKMTEVAIA